MYTSNLLPTTRFWKINDKKVKRIPLLEINYVFSFGLEFMMLNGTSNNIANKGNNKITELRTILQREIQNS